jgi:hydroxymethylbilane synthase
MKDRILRIGARGSPLSLAQTGAVARALEAVNPGLRTEIVPIRTGGDDPGRAPLGDSGIKGLFVKEIEDALLEGAVDLAVHSAKDLPARLPQGLVLGAAPERASPFDALIGPPSLGSLPRGARVGTSSLRRRAQLLALRPDLEIAPLRGNVDTRLGKVASGEFDATLLGASGLARLKGPGFPVNLADPSEILPAPGQGQLGLELREGDTAVSGFIAPLDHPPSAAALAAERGFMEALGAGCQTPAACWARFDADGLVAAALVCETDGSLVLREEAGTGDVAAPPAGGAGGASGGPGAAPDASVPDAALARALGRLLAERLLAKGAADILARAERGL